MTIRRRKWCDPATGNSKEAWMVDVSVIGKDGQRRRERRIAPIQNRRAAERLEHELRQQLMDSGGVPTAPPIEPPPFVEFAERFLDTYARTNNSNRYMKGGSSAGRARWAFFAA